MLFACDSPFDFDGLHYVEDNEASHALSLRPDPAVIIVASGMCDGGRVRHHLRSTVEDAKKTMFIVGFQARQTLGRRQVERRPWVRIFGVERDRRAEVVVLNGYSAHARRDDLRRYSRATRDAGSVATIALVHGERCARVDDPGALLRGSVSPVSTACEAKRSRVEPHAVCRHEAPSGQQHHVAGHHLRGAHPRLGAVAAHPSPRGDARAEGLDGAARTALLHGAEHAAEQQDGRDDCVSPLADRARDHRGEEQQPLEGVARLREDRLHGGPAGGGFGGTGSMLAQAAGGLVAGECLRDVEPSVERRAPAGTDH